MPAAPTQRLPATASSSHWAINESNFCPSVIPSRSCSRLRGERPCTNVASSPANHIVLLERSALRAGGDAARLPQIFRRRSRVPRAPQSRPGQLLVPAWSRQSARLGRKLARSRTRARNPGATTTQRSGNREAGGAGSSESAAVVVRSEPVGSPETVLPAVSPRPRPRIGAGARAPRRDRRLRLLDCCQSVFNAGARASQRVLGG